jgi:hypothetical protein
MNAKPLGVEYGPRSGRAFLKKWREANNLQSKILGSLRFPTRPAQQSKVVVLSETPIAASQRAFRSYKFANLS